MKEKQGKTWIENNTAFFLLVSAAFIILIVVEVYSYESYIDFLNMNKALEAAFKEQQIFEEIERVLFTAIIEERTYLLTNSPENKAMYEKLKTLTLQQTEKLEMLPSDLKGPYVIPQNSLETLKDLITQKFTYLDAHIETRIYCPRPWTSGKKISEIKTYSMF